MMRPGSSGTATVNIDRLVHNVHEQGFTALDKVGLNGQRDQGLVSTLISRDLSGSDDMSVSWGKILPGQHHLCHHHPDASEFYVVLSGAPIVHLGSTSYRAKPGDGIYIPRGTTHGLTNDSEKDVELIVGVSKPADWQFVPDE